jgi:hypothetical protein
MQNMLRFRLRLNELPPPSGLSDDQLLDVIDALLAHWLDPDWNQAMLTELDELLTQGGAGWRVNAKQTGLERRVNPAVTTTVAATIRIAGDEAADHLNSAWTAAYGRNLDPDKAYDEAVLAVEALACPLVCPNNPRRTLGTVIADLGNQTTRWELAIGDSTGQPAGTHHLTGMLTLLWQGQSRHAGSPNSRRQTQSEAEAAVHLAATLVQWLSTGVVRRRTR